MLTITSSPKLQTTVVSKQILMHSESEGSPKVQKVPFRISGRGSKQLSKAMEQTIERGHYSNEISWVFSTGNHPCFAKVVSMTTGGVMIQPMSPIDGDSDIYQPWEGHLWMEKRENIFPVEVVSYSLMPQNFVLDETRTSWVESMLHAFVEETNRLSSIESAKATLTSISSK